MIGSRRAAAALEQASSRRILLALVAQELSPSTLSERTGLSLSLLHHHLGKLLGLGLISVAGETKRAGRPVRCYRAVAHEFFVPGHLRGDGPGRALARELAIALEASRAREGGAGVAYYIDEGRPRMRIVRDAGGEQYFEAWLRLSLTRRQASELAGDLDELFHRYAAGGKQNEKTHLAYVAIARSK